MFFIAGSNVFLFSYLLSYFLSLYNVTIFQSFILLVEKFQKNTVFVEFCRFS